MMLLLILEGMGTMVVSFGSLLTEHIAGDRRIPVAMIREYFPEVENRRWQAWRERAGVPKASRSMSDLSALKLWAIAKTRGQLDDQQVRENLIRTINCSPQRVEEWLLRHRWVVSPETAKAAGFGRGDEAVIEAITNIAPFLDVRYRGRLYEWFDRAGLKYSTKGTYTRTEIMRVVAVAKRGVDKGRPRKNSVTYSGDQTA